MSFQEINGQVVEDAPYHDMSDHACSFPEDQSKCDFIVHVGVCVSYTENYETQEMGDKVYMVVNMPDSANMVEMREITDMSGQWPTWKANPDMPLISVEPWKIGLV